MAMGFAFQLHPYFRGDRDRVWRLLRFLPELYPNGAEWLDNRLNDILEGKAECVVAVRGPYLCGLTIETPKGIGNRKLSTIYVDPRFREAGVGRALIRKCMRKWVTRDIKNAYVTADSVASCKLSPLLRSFGFQIIARDVNRYAEGRDELVYQWTPRHIPENC